MPPILGALAAGAAATVAAAGSALAGTFAFLSGGSMLAGIINIGFSMAAQYVLGTLFAPKPTAQASRLEVTYGDKRPREVILGRVAVAGHHVFRNAYGSGNRRVVDVYRLSDFRITDIPRMEGKGSWRTVTGDTDSILGNDVTIRKHYGTDTTADAWIIDKSNGRWKETSVGVGIAYAAVNTRMDIEDLTAPWEGVFEVIGPNLYDWRSDDTAGGDGDDRWNDPDTWTGDPENPVLQMYLLERGVFVNGKLIVGKGVPASRLPLAEWTVAANVCEELVNGLTPRYRSSLIAVSGAGATHDTNLQPLLEACAASWVDDATGEYPIVGAPQAVVATFTDDDLVPNEPLRFSAKRRRVELVNTVAGSYIEPSLFYEETPLATRIDPDALIIDGETLAVSLPFTAVTYSEQGDRLADIQIRASRYQANAEITLRPKFLALKPGRWVTWDSARYGERTFLVVSKRLGALDSRGPRNVHLTLQEVGDGIFDPTAYETVPTAPLPPGTPDYQSEVDNIVVQPWVLTSGSETAPQEIPAIRVAFDTILDESIVAVDFEYWPTDQPTEINYDTLPMPATAKFLTVGVISNTEYQVRYKLRAEPARAIPWVGPYAVTTPAAAATDITVKLSNLSPAVKQLLQNSIAQLALAQAKLQQLAAAVTDGTTQASDARAVAVRYQEATAAAMSALSATVSEFEGDITANAEAITAVNATLGTTSAGALFRLFASAGTGDVLSRIDLQVRASLGSSEWVTAGTIWEVGVDDVTDELFGRIVLSATQTMIADQMGNVVALFDEDGVHLSNAFIANLTGDQIAFNTLTGDHIVVASIDSPSLAFQAVTSSVELVFDHTQERDMNAGSYNSGEVVMASGLVENPAGNPVLMIIRLGGRVTVDGTGGGTSTVRIRREGVLIREYARTASSWGYDETTIYDATPGEGTYTYTVSRQYQGSGGGSTSVRWYSMSDTALVFWKR